MVDVDLGIQTGSEHSIAICIAKMQKDITWIREKLDKEINDHEERIRILEKEDEVCKQEKRINKAEYDIETLYKNVEKVSDKLNEHIVIQKTNETTSDTTSFRRREWVLLIAGIIGGAIVTALATEIIGNVL